MAFKFNPLTGNFDLVSTVAAGGTLSGGTNKRVLFDDSNTIGEDTHFNWDKSTRTLQLGLANGTAGRVQFQGSNVASGSVTIQGPVSVSSYTMLLPNFLPAVNNIPYVSGSAAGVATLNWRLFDPKAQWIYNSASDYVTWTGDGGNTAAFFDGSGQASIGAGNGIVGSVAVNSGGFIDITAGSGGNIVNDVTTGGIFYVLASDGSGLSIASAVQLNSGDGSGLTLYAGQAGTVTIYSADAGDLSGSNGGVINIIGGAADTTDPTFLGGNVTINGGGSQSASSDGQVRLANVRGGVTIGSFTSASPGGLVVSGKVGFATNSVTAYLTLGAGTATANTSPLKFLSGTNLTTPEAGAMEFTNPDLFFTPSSAVRYSLPLVTGAGTQGDIIYASAASVYSRLAKNTSSTRYLSNTGTSNNPAWAQIALTTGVTGTLPVANGGTGSAVNFQDNVALTNQGADIATTNFTNGGTAGTYRVSYSLEDTTSDLTAGAVTLTIAYTDGAGATTTTANQVLTGVGRVSGSVFIQLASGNITYATAHTGIFGTAKYALYMCLERLS